MADPTASLRVVLSGGDMTFSGNDDTNPLGLIAFTEPALVHRRTYADPSPHDKDMVMTQSVPDQSNLTAVVGLKGTSQTSLEAAKAALRAAASASRQWVTEQNGYQLGWFGDTAEMAPEGEPDDYNNLAGYEAFYTLTIPVRSLPEVI